MKKAIIYHSQTGFTRKYAEWLSDDLGCKALPYRERTSVDLGNLDLLLFCSWFHAASVKGAKWLKRAMAEHPDLKVIVLVTGAMPMPCDEWPASEVEEAFRRTFPTSEFPDLPWFYCHGGFDSERLGAADKIAMGMFFKMNEKAAETDPKAAEMLRVMRQGFDGTKREYLQPIIACIRHMEEGTRKC